MQKILALFLVIFSLAIFLQAQESTPQPTSVSVLGRLQKLEEENIVTKNFIAELLRQNQELLKQNQESQRQNQELLKQNQELLNLLSLQAEPENLALGKTASQSSVYGIPNEGKPQNAIDGNTDGAWTHGSVIHTYCDSNGGSKEICWWEVDLGKTCRISEVKIYKRTDCHTDGQSSHFYLMISIPPFPNEVVPGSGADGIVRLTHEGNIESLEIFKTKNVLGRYVRIQRKTKGPLTLAEVEVWGR